MYFVAPIEDLKISDKWMSQGPSLSICKYVPDLLKLSTFLTKDGQSITLETPDLGDFKIVRGSTTKVVGAYAPLSHDSRFIPLDDIVSMSEEI